MAGGPRRPAFVGRADERRQIAELVEGIVQGAGAALVVEGEAGIGKSRLVSECLPEPECGARVLRGQCEPATQVQPFWSLAHAFEPVAQADAPPGEALAPLFEATEVTRETGHTPASQFRVVQAIEQCVELLAAEGPLCIVIEDLHWTDPSTLVALRSVARRTEHLPLLLIVTMRPGHGVRDLHRFTDDVLRSGGHRLRLAPLDETRVLELATELLEATPGGSLVDRLRGAAGNPLFVIEYTNALLQAGAIAIEGATAQMTADAIPFEFRDAVARRLAELTDDTADVLRSAALLGTSFTPADVAAVRRANVVELTEAIREAVEAGLIAERGAELAFVHDLLREAIYQSIPSSVRKQLHRELAHVLEETDRPALLIAHHQSLAADDRDEEAAAWLRRAASEITARAPATAVDLLERARELLRPDDPRRVEMLAELVMPLAWSGRLSDAESIGRQVIERQPSPAVAGPLRCALVYALAWQGRPKEALEYAEPKEELREDDALLLRAEVAVARMFSFDLKGAAADSGVVVQKADVSRDDLALTTALGLQAFLATLRGDTEQAIASGRRAVEIADNSPDDRPHLAAPRFFLGMPLIASDRLDEAEDVLQTGRRVAEELGHVWSLPLYHAYLGTTRFAAGNWDDAVVEFETSVQIADEIGMRMIVFVAVTAWLAVIHVHRGDLELAEEALNRAEQRVAESGPQIGMNLLAWGRALLHEARGAGDAALAVLQNAWDFSIAAGLHAEPWSGAALLRMYARAGRRDDAAALVPSIEEQAKHNPTPFMQARGLGARGLAEADEEMLLAAVEMYRKSPRPHELALACEDAGTVIGRAGNVEKGAALLDEAISIFEKVGAERDVARARAVLRELGVRRASARAARRPTHGWDSLTPTELKVVRLVSQRLSNPEIAERLFVSRHTVESHLKHIYAKLGLSSRRELADETIRRGSAAVAT